METFEIGYFYETFDNIIGVGVLSVDAEDESEVQEHAFRIVIDKLKDDAFDSEFAWHHDIQNIKISVKKATTI